MVPKLTHKWVTWLTARQLVYSPKSSKKLVFKKKTFIKHGLNYVIKIISSLVKHRYSSEQGDFRKHICL